MEAPRGSRRAILQRLSASSPALDRSDGPEGMDLPGFRLHPLKGRMKVITRYRSPAIGG